MRAEGGRGDARGVEVVEGDARTEEEGIREVEGGAEVGFGLGFSGRVFFTARTSVFTLNFDFWLKILIFGVGHAGEASGAGGGGVVGKVEKQRVYEGGFDQE